MDNRLENLEVPREKLDLLVQRIVEAAHPLRIILFGSHARGKAHPRSDIDVTVVVPDGMHRRETAAKICEALVGTGICADIVMAHPFDLEYYADVPGYIYREALRDGIHLYAA